ncbi:hypothetical protein VKT23_008478 [Stygiomarasmius scandens]|uniref:chitin deacetylase n=1 Tax=Marasmiellus scandens TaxID=2682957 RepID=A0ABR1JGI8_9AGAR
MRFSTSALISLYTSCLLVGVSRAQDRTTEQGEANIQDPAQECSPYFYAPVSAALSSFPPIWQPATIVAGDTVAMDKWKEIEGSIPGNISVKHGAIAISSQGTITGDFTPGYSPTDPDCWWTSSRCLNPKLPGLPPDIADVPEPNTLGYGFDDGPNCSHNAFYDYLASKNQTATMFFIGSNVLDWPLEAQRALTDGLSIHCIDFLDTDWMLGSDRS